MVHRHLDHIRSGIPLPSGGARSQTGTDDFDIVPPDEASTDEQSDDNVTDSVGAQPQPIRSQRTIRPPLRYRDQETEEGKV